MTENRQPASPPGPAREKQEARRLLEDVRNLVAFHQALNINGYPLSPELGRFLTGPSPGREASPAGRRKGRALHEAAPAGDKATLADIREDLGDCGRCPLHKERRRIVFGTGNPAAKLFLIGDWPGPEDDLQGSPFRGPAGELLDKMLVAIALNRKDVYLTTLLKCRPPDNQAPGDREIKTCLPFLLRQLNAVAPRIICTMGAVTAQTLLNTQEPLVRLRGRFHAFNGIALMPTFHPEFLINNQEMKKAAWIDLQLIRKKIAG